MRKISSFLAGFLLLLSLQAGGTAPVDPNYHQQIALAAGASPAIRQTAEILAHRLEQITGKTFSITEPEGDSSRDTILLLTAEQARAVPEFAPLLTMLDAANPEAFVLDSRPDAPGLRIVGHSEAGVRHGVYRYLHELGFRSLFPGEHWQIVPRRENIRMDLSRSEAPAYLQRVFFGTGGFHNRLPLDPAAKIAKMWQAWRDANLFGTSIALPGHYGEAFINKHKPVLEAHPEYRAMVKGKRVPMSGQFQINYGNPELRELYIQDRLADLKAAVERDASGTKVFSVSVDPADGDGHCESPEAAALGSISDRVFGLANEVAKRVDAEFPGHYVNLYAYNAHADIPTFPLEKNVIVSVIPYGFNRAKTLLGDDLLVAWKEKATLLGLYDYWGLPDWSRGQPSLDYINAIPRKLRFWHDNHVRFFNAETTTGAGTAGITLYLASKMLWDPRADPKAVLDEFYDLAFGVARPPMQRMLERWTTGFHLQDNEIALSFRDLEEARRLAGDDASLKARVGDFITYVHYLRLLREFDAAADNEAKYEAADALLRFIWQIRDNAMVQTFRIAQLMRNTWFKNEELRATWDYDNPEAPGWATVPAAPKEADLAALLSNGRETYPVLFEPRTFSSDLVPLEPAADAGTGTGEAYRMIGRHTFVFQADRDDPMEFSVRFGSREKASVEAVVSVREAEGEKSIFHASYPLDGEWHSFSIPVKKGKNYQLVVDDRSAHFNLRAPSGLPLVLTGGLTPVHWHQVKNWFFVPKGTERFAISIPRNPIPQNLKVMIDDHVIVEPLANRGGFSVYEVPGGEDGKVWSMEKFVTSRRARLFNIPDHLAFSADTIMVPKETLPKK